jgi:hypothetical protein
MYEFDPIKRSSRKRKNRFLLFYLDITKNLISASIMPNTCKKPVDPKGGNGTIPNGNGTSPNGNGTNPNGTDPNGNKNGTGNCPNKTNCTSKNLKILHIIYKSIYLLINNKYNK